MLNVSLKTTSVMGTIIKTSRWKKANNQSYKQNRYPPQVKISLVASRTTLGLELCQNNSKKDMVTTRNASGLLKQMVLLMQVSSLVENVGLEMNLVNMARHPIENATWNASMTKEKSAELD